jgi:hypothetical protein
MKLMNRTETMRESFVPKLNWNFNALMFSLANIVEVPRIPDCSSVTVLLIDKEYDSSPSCPKYVLDCRE